MPGRITSPFGTISLFSGEHDSLIEQVFGRASETGQKPEDTVLAGCFTELLTGCYQTDQFQIACQQRAVVWC